MLGYRLTNPQAERLTRSQLGLACVFLPLWAARESNPICPKTARLQRAVPPWNLRPIGSGVGCPGAFHGIYSVVKNLHSTVASQFNTGEGPEDHF